MVDKVQELEKPDDSDHSSVLQNQNLLDIYHRNIPLLPHTRANQVSAIDKTSNLEEEKKVKP